jgi:lipoprotein-releasing system permease protein
MYKLFLCLKYLRKRALAYFAMVGVALCVFMMLVAVSVLNGFVDKIERAAKGLFGDIVISAPSLGGLSHYDEFIRKLRRDVPAVEGASPFILTFGILRVPGTDYRRTVQIAGIRLPERADVSDFEEGLFVQEGIRQPTFDPNITALVLPRLEDEYDATARILDRELKEPDSGQPQPEQEASAKRIANALDYQEIAIDNVMAGLDPNLAGFIRQDLKRLGGLAVAARNAGNDAEAARLERRITRRMIPIGSVHRDLRQLRKLLAAAEEAGDDAKVARLERSIAQLERKVILPPERRAILGLGIAGLTNRTSRGETIRTIGPGHQIVLSLIPLGRRLSYVDITPNTRSFTVIDDCSTDVASIDSEIVYVDFQTLQQLNNMLAGPSEDDPNVMDPPRCSQVHVKVAEAQSRGYELQAVARRIERAWAEFVAENPEAERADVRVETWRQRQSRLVSSIEAQRTLMVIILGIISSVAVVLIFVIMYVIVVQKTRDIGVLKAVGASSIGVAGIFLAYGAAIGLVGSAFGTLGGYYFVRNINPIHDWIGRTFGFVVWSRETFMFEKIPNEVGLVAAVNIVVGAVLSGVLGSLIPAIRAARQEPVEALRYE